MAIRMITDVEEVRPVVEEFGKSFYEEGRVPGNFDQECFIRSWTSYLRIGSGVIWALERDKMIVGGLGALMYPDPYDGEVVATEAFWFVKRSDRRGVGGLRLLNYFETWAREVGCRRVIMVHLIDSMPKKLCALYEARGYRAVETNYVKGLKP